MPPHSWPFNLCSNREVWKRLAESNGTLAMDLEFVDIRTRIYTNKRGIEQNSHVETRNMYDWQPYETGIDFFFPLHLRNLILDFEISMFILCVWIIMIILLVFFFLMCLYFIVNFIQFWYEVYDQDYVHTNRHREMGTHSNLSWGILYGTERKPNIVLWPAQEWRNRTSNATNRSFERWLIWL